MIGYSGATITVTGNYATKRGGGHDLQAQARLVKALGPPVAPLIFETTSNGYTMERLEQFPPPADQEAIFNLAQSVIKTLAGQVWTRPTAFPHDVGWRTDLRLWCEANASWLPVMNHHAAPPVLTHGDPTFANLMLTAQGGLKLIDPSPPRPGIPSLPAVDLGKVVQSLMGWEARLDPAWPQPGPRVLKEFLQCLSPEARLGALFWGAFACARVMVRAKTDDIREWGKRSSKTLTWMMNQ